jgi:hypothetical protein
MSGYFDRWKEEDFACSQCGWEGKGAKLVCTRTDQYSAFLHCPRCRTLVYGHRWPNVQDARAHWDELSDEERRTFRELERKLAVNRNGA